MEPIPDYAYLWRPFAARDLVVRPFKQDGGRYDFVIDPWTQRWAINRPAATSLLTLADGTTRFTSMMREISVRHPEISGEIAVLAQELVSHGLLFDGQAEHRASGIAVYGATEPIGIHLEITNACNMVCEHCYVSSGHKLPDELTLAEIKRIIDMMPPFSGKRVAISGGEPAVRKDCGEIVEYCALEVGHDVDLYTNGKRFPEKLIKRIAAVNAAGRGRVRLQVSLEGATAEVNDVVRGAGSFDEAMKSLGRFQDAGQGPNVVLFVCMTKANIHQLDDIIRLGERFDAGMVVFSQWQRQGNAGDTPWASIAPSVAEWVEAGERILAYDNPRMRVFGNFFGELDNDGFGGTARQQPFYKHIYAYNVVPRITPQGDVFADQLWVDDSWKLGNLRDMTLEECFQTPKFFEQLDSFRHRVDHIPICQECEWVRLCEAGRRATPTPSSGMSTNGTCSAKAASTGSSDL